MNEPTSIPAQDVRTLLERALRIAKEATNGWACYAKRKREHDDIGRLHRLIVECERDRASLLTAAARQPSVPDGRDREAGAWFLVAAGAIPDPTLRKVAQADPRRPQDDERRDGRR